MIFYIKFFFCVGFILIGFIPSNGQSLNIKNKIIPNEHIFVSFKEPNKESNPDIEILLNNRSISNKEFTKRLQEIVDRNSVVILPNKPILISKKGLVIKSNKTIVFQKNTKLKVEANELEHYGIINIIDANNVKIINPQIEGDRYEHKNMKGEWGHGINILGGEDIIIENFVVSNCWGDGIYIGRSNSRISKNITLNRGLATNNRRNGISITSVSGLVINKVTSAFTNGTAPEFGIDIEPNSHLDVIEGIEIIDNVSYYNQKGGLAIGVNKIGVNSPKIKNINISINNFTDYGSYYGLYVGNITSGANRIKGNLSLNNLKMFYNQLGIYIKSNQASKFDIYVNSFDIIEPKNRNADKKEHMRTLRLRKDIRLK